MAKQPYQVTAQDKDLATLAANLGMDFQAVQQANPYINSISEGQYITVPTTAPNIAPTVNAIGNIVPAATVPTGSFLAGGGTSALGFKAATVQPSLMAAKEGAGITTSIGGFQTPATGTGSGLPKKNPDPYLAGLETQAVIGSFGNAYSKNDPSLLPQTMTKEQWKDAGIDPNTISEYYDMQKDGTYKLKGSLGQTAQQQQQANNPGAHYVDDKTKPLVGKELIINGKRRILRADKNGRLYYEKPNNRKDNDWDGVLVKPIKPPRADAPSTVLNIVLGS